LIAREGKFFAIRLDKVLSNFRPDEFEPKSQMPYDGIVAENGMFFLNLIEGPDDAETGK
jgi:hypothetical protein